MSNSNAFKKALAPALTAIAQQRALDEIRRTGKRLPCRVIGKSGSIVTVRFDVTSEFTIPDITIPHFGPDWIRYPTQVGDLGVTQAADVHIGGVTGLGGGTADMTTPGNLTALYFIPLANMNWTPEDPNTLVMKGPGGVLLKDVGAACTLSLTPTGVVISVGGMTCTINASGIKVVSGDVVADTISLKHHHHVQSTGGNTGEAVP